MARQPRSREDVLAELRAQEAELVNVGRVAGDLVEEEGRGVPTRVSVGKPKRTSSPRISAVIRQLRRIADDPKSGRSATARQLLREIEQLQARVGKLNRELQSGRMPYQGQGSSARQDERVKQPPARQLNMPSKARASEPGKMDHPKSSNPPVGGQATSIAPPVRLNTADKASIRKAFANAVVSSQRSLERAQQFTKRLQGYLRAWNKLSEVLNLLSAIDSMQNLLAHGTALPKEQREAKEVEKNSEEAKNQAEAATESISLLGWIVTVGEAIRSADDATLFQFDVALGNLSTALDSSAKPMKKLADDLSIQANALHGQMYKQLLGVVTPHTGGTASNAVAFALFQSLELLRGTISTAATNYAAASDTLTQYAEPLNELRKTAEENAWAIAQKRAVHKLEKEKQLEESRQLKSYLPRPGETAEEKESREFIEKLALHP